MIYRGGAKQTRRCSTVGVGTRATVHIRGGMKNCVRLLTWITTTKSRKRMKSSWLAGSKPIGSAAAANARGKVKKKSKLHKTSSNGLRRRATLKTSV